MQRHAILNGRLLLRHYPFKLNNLSYQSLRYLTAGSGPNTQDDYHSSSFNHNNTTSSLFKLAAFGLAATGIFYYSKQHLIHVRAFEQKNLHENVAGDYVEGLPVFTREEVTKHKNKEDRIWMTYKHGVYDITDLVPKHPGGRSILKAAGAAAEPAWAPYPVHQKPEILHWLEQYRIGNLPSGDEPPAVLLSKGVSEKEAGKFIEGLPVYTVEDVAKHQDPTSGIWITYKSGVYDITQFIKSHPGGSSKVMLAAGGSVEPFWSLYAIHKQPHILALLEEYRIGNLAKGEDYLAMENISDPYANEPYRHPALIVRNKQPFNAEPPTSLLVESYITPTEIFYVRNHLPVPDVDPTGGDYTLEVVGNSEKQTLNLSLDQLKTVYVPHTITAALQCTGNRRSEMTQVKPVRGLLWAQGAMGNAEWKGARLRDVLIDAGFKEDDDNENWHVCFEGLDLDPTSMPYGASISLSTAMDKNSDVLLAYEMNGEPLSRDHGFPVRVVVPGTTGARWVKWLTKIEVSKEESTSHWQRLDYKGFNPSTDWDNIDWDSAKAVQEMPVTSVFCDPEPGDVVQRIDGKIKLRGYAWSGGGCGIIRVDVSLDQGRTWHVAHLVDPSKNHRQWAWTRWQIEVPIADKDKEVEAWVRAVDSHYNVQPESMHDIWNLRGILATGYHKVKIAVNSA